jgi:hypothetical protein
VRRAAIVLAVVGVLFVMVVPVGIWLLVRCQPKALPEISAYSSGYLTRVGPYTYCQVLDLNDCVAPETIGVLPVKGRSGVQLSVDDSIGRGLWSVLRLYDNPNDNGEDKFRPGTLAATISTVGPAGGRLDQLEIHLWTRARTPSGEDLFIAHAVWSVRTVWP